MKAESFYYSLRGKEANSNCPRLAGAQTSFPSRRKHETVGGKGSLAGSQPQHHGENIAICWALRACAHAASSALCTTQSSRPTFGQAHKPHLAWCRLVAKASNT